MPGGVTETIARLRRESARPEGLQTDPLALPGGAAGERAWHDRETARRQRFKTLLAGNKLHAGLVTAALGRPAPDGAPEAPGVADDGVTGDGVTDYVARASRWIGAVTDALARRWGAGAGAEDATAGATGEVAGGAGLSGYHRYELARTLVAALGELPELPERVDPDQMAAYLAAPAPALPPEPPAPARVSAGPQADRALPAPREERRPPRPRPSRSGRCGSIGCKPGKKAGRSTSGTTPWSRTATPCSATCCATCAPTG